MEEEKEREVLIFGATSSTCEVSMVLSLPSQEMHNAIMQ
jgi:hypothetical protein